jgi:glyoxylase-like metal-dependent hydrolase (beta-lactamase superfamily II)/rhodanese-related sulfurtransferase
LPVLFRQFVDDDLGCASYLIGDESSGEAVVVDPAYAIEQYLDEAEKQKARIVRVLETHTHADHISGHGRFALEHGLPIAIHAAAEPEYASDPLENGQELELGEVVIRVLHTPGHRPEHCCFAVIDRSRGDEPWLLITGDSLLVGDAARPDLASAAEEGARGMLTSLQKLLDLPDGVQVYPGHVAGSLCGAGMSSMHASTIGFERRFNHKLELVERDEEEFVAESTQSSAPRPPNMERIVELNRGPFVAAQPPVAAGEIDGVTVLDVRRAREFVQGHVEGAFNVPFSGSKFATKSAFILGPDEPVVIHASSEDEAQRAAKGLHAVGLFEVRGFVADADVTATTQPVAVDELERLVAQDGIELLDVREKDERDEGYIVGSRHMPYRLVREFADDFDNGDKTVVTICSSGARATIAASVLEAAGVRARPVLGGGVDDYAERGGDTVQFRRCGN